jgi:metallo-beta-lactamase family protein
LPLLVKRGFRGEIIATAPTHELVRIVLEDAARIEEEDAARRARWRSRGHSSQRSAAGAALAADAPLYTAADAQAAIDLFGRSVSYQQVIALGTGLQVSFHDAGHILGSASVLVEARDGARTRRVLFSGDIGNRGRPILADPAPPRADIVLMETTYGNRLHRSVKDSVEELYVAIEAALHRGGNVVIPSFALERTQEILYFLREAVSSGRLPRQLPVFLDSPMAASAIEVYRRHPQFYDAQAAALVADGSNPFDIPGLRLTRSREESMAINRVAGGAVIIAGSGMCTGGRVRYHLMHNLSRPACSIVFVGFAARGTPARQIIDGARNITLMGEDLPVRAHIHTINGFSAHADQNELLHWHSMAGGAERTILVHGEVSSMEAFAQKLGKVPISMPGPGDELEL